MEDAITATTERIDAILAIEPRKPSAAYEQILEISLARLERLTRSMLRGYPSLARWEQTDDVFQEAVVRLYRTLKKVQPKSARHYFGLAAMQIRRSLIDLARHHLGPMATAANHESRFDIAEMQHNAEDEGPCSLAAWAEFHEAVEKLPEKQREVFSLVWYAGSSQSDAAKILNTSTKTVQRRFLEARLTLAKVLQE